MSSLAWSTTQCVSTRSERLASSLFIMAKPDPGTMTDLCESYVNLTTEYDFEASPNIVPFKQLLKDIVCKAVPCIA
jgi:hypothetical protein